MATSYLPRSRSSVTALAVIAVMATAACEKDYEFFTLVDDLFEGDIAARVTGIPGGAPVLLSGMGINLTRVTDAAGRVFEELPAGTYQLTVEKPDGYLCIPTTVTVQLTEASPTGVAEFNCTPIPGELTFNVGGLFNDDFSLPVNLTGSTTRQIQFGNGAGTAGNLGIGQLNWTLGTFLSHDCAPASGSFNIAPGGEYTQQIDCMPVKGKLTFNLSGLYNTTYKLPVELTGSMTQSLLLNNGATSVNQVEFGALQWNAAEPEDHDCAPLSGNLVFLPGTDIQIQVGCQPHPGSIAVTVSGTTAQVNYAGPASGGAAVGEAPVVFGNLPAGTYTVSITEPDGFDCEPASIPVTLAIGGEEEVQFTCIAEEPEEEELVEYSVDLLGFRGSPGFVPAGTYQRPVLDNLMVAIATIAISTIGNQTFYGIGPARLGFDGSSGYQLDVLFPVAALFFRVRAIQICTINALLSGSNFLAVSYYTAAAVLLANAGITSAPGCFWLDVPATTRFIRLMGPAIGFVDIHGLQLRGVLAP